MDNGASALPVTENFGQIDLLIEPEWIIPIEPAGLILVNHSIAIQNGRILDVLPSTEAQQKFRPNETMTLPGHVVLPGLINLHTHAAMNLLRGYADDLPLMQWLNDRIWPVEARLASPSFVHDGTLLACAEMLRGGVTCFNDMYFFPQASAEAAVRMGMRAAIGLVVIDFPSNYAADVGDYLSKGLACRDLWKDDPLLSFNLAPHAPYTVSDASFERIAVLADQLDLGIHIHLHETHDEIAQSLKQYGIRPLARLHRLGLLSPQFLAVHAVHLEISEIELLQKFGAHIAHCPSSNLKLGSGIAPVAKMKQLGLNFGIGTDSAASNNRLDSFAEMRLASLLAKGVSGDATALDSHQSLHAATLGGACALGLESVIGSISKGKFADLCAVRLDDWQLLPRFDVASHLVNVATRNDVSHVWVAGIHKLKDGILLPIDGGILADTAEMWQNRILNV
ncbi:MAG: TRZ/ATZ family hydrolase [Rhodocyclaceae bacterium]|nr:TRZ/ATZ family hydrolase [Rhodocyclaceae bacterium]